MADGNTTQNTSAVIKAQVYSDVILEQLMDGFLPDSLIRDVSDFGNGDTLYIPTIGETVIHDYAEDTAAKYDPVDTGQISMSITEYKQAGTYVTDKLKQDAYALSAIESQIPQQHLYRIKEAYETGLLATANNQTLGNPNTINGFDHRFVASTAGTGGSEQILGVADFVYMRLAFQKANVPEGNWIAIVDPISEAALNSQAGDAAFSQHAMWTDLLETGFSRDHKFLYNIMGFDVWTSNRLPRITSETITGGPSSTALTADNAIANIFMALGDDMTMPFMGAWRQMPKTIGEYNRQFVEWIFNNGEEEALAA